MSKNKKDLQIIEAQKLLEQEKALQEARKTVAAGEKLAKSMLKRRKGQTLAQVVDDLVDAKKVSKAKKAELLNELWDEASKSVKSGQEAELFKKLGKIAEKTNDLTSPTMMQFMKDSLNRLESDTTTSKASFKEKQSALPEEVEQARQERLEELKNQRQKLTSKYREEVNLREQLERRRQEDAMLHKLLPEHRRNQIVMEDGMMHRKELTDFDLAHMYLKAKENSTESQIINELREHKMMRTGIELKAEALNSIHKLIDDPLNVEKLIRGVSNETKQEGLDVEAILGACPSASLKDMQKALKSIDNLQNELAWEKEQRQATRSSWGISEKVWTEALKPILRLFHVIHASAKTKPEIKNIAEEFNRISKAASESNDLGFARATSSKKLSTPSQKRSKKSDGPSM